MHQQAIEKIKTYLENDPRYIALIICGSVATGKARKDSDIDFYIVATDQEFEELCKTKNFYFGNNYIEDIEIELDGKVVNMQYLIDASTKGSEPTRASFYKAYCPFDHSGKIAKIVDNILVYPEDERDSKLKKFYSLFEFNHYYGSQALKTDNSYLLTRCITDMIFYASRIVITYNRLLFPCHKSMFATLEQADKIPPDFIKTSKEVLEKPTEEKLDQYFDLIYDFFADLRLSESESVGYILENEWAWFTEKLPVGEL